MATEGLDLSNKAKLRSIADTPNTFPFTLVVLLGLYYLMKPFYLWDSGLPQVADGIAVALFLVVLGSGFKLELPESRYVTMPAILFCAWAAVVGLFWSLITLSQKTYMPIFFYTFNVIVMFSFLRAFEIGGLKIVEIFGKIAAGVLIIYFFASFVAPSTGAFRSNIYLNNPNQLAYWTLLAACILAACDHIVKMRRDILIAALACGAYISALALSKSGMAAYALLLALTFSKRKSLLIGAAVLALPLMFLDAKPEFVEKVGQRVEAIGEDSDDSVAGRGIDRIWRYPQYVAIGAGEGHQMRLGEHGEIHSTLASALFNYGVIGFLLFVTILWRLIKVGGYTSAIFLAPPMVYGLTHQGLRFSLLWVLFAVLAYGAAVRNAEKAAARTLGLRPEPTGRMPMGQRPSRPAQADEPSPNAAKKPFSRPSPRTVVRHAAGRGSRPKLHHGSG